MILHSIDRCKLCVHNYNTEIIHLNAEKRLGRAMPNVLDTKGRPYTSPRTRNIAGEKNKDKVVWPLAERLCISVCMGIALYCSVGDASSERGCDFVLVSAM